MHFRTNRALEITETSRLFILSTSRKGKQLKLQHVKTLLTVNIEII